MAISRRTLFAAGATAALGPVVKAAGPGLLKIGNSAVTLDLELTRGGVARMVALRNTGSAFNWTSPLAAAGPKFTSSGLSGPAATLQSWKAAGSRVDLTYDIGGRVAVEQRYATVPGMPVVECSSHFRNHGSEPVEDVQAVGIRIPLRADQGRWRSIARAAQPTRFSAFHSRAGWS